MKCSNVPARLAGSLSLVLLISTLAAPCTLLAQDKPPAPDRAKVVAAAREVMAAQTYCALATIDETGRPQVRTMNPFPPEEDMTVWVATNTNSRKVQEIRKDPGFACTILTTAKR